MFFYLFICCKFQVFFNRMRQYCDSYFAGQKVPHIGAAVHSPDFYVAPWGKPPSKKNDE